MKIAVSGKGGVGKTTITASLAQLLTEVDYKVLAIDADPDANLALAMGFSAAEEIVPLTQMDALIEERTGAKAGTFGSYFKLNPRVDDIPEKVGVDVDGVKLLVMGTVAHGGQGCVCPENALLKALLKHVLLQRDELVIMDMEAGLEHLGRGTTEAVDALIIVVEPDQRSIQTARTIRELAKDLGVRLVYVVLNQIEGDDQEKLVRRELEGFTILGAVAYYPSVRQAALTVASAHTADDSFKKDVTVIRDALVAELAEKAAQG